MTEPTLKKNKSGFVCKKVLNFEGQNSRFGHETGGGRQICELWEDLRKLLKISDLQ